MKANEEAEIKSHLRPTDLKIPFQVTRDDDDRSKDKGKIKSIRLNEDELIELRQLMDLIDTDVEGAAIKFFYRVGINVIQGSVGKPNIAWLSNRYRVRSLRKSPKNSMKSITEKLDEVKNP